MVVGTDIGVVHKQKQGTGLATELTDSTSDDYLMKYADSIAAGRAQAAQAKKAEMDAAATKLKEINPDFFFKHKEEITTAAQSLRELGVQLLKQGKNPYSDDAFIKAQGELSAASKYSVQDMDAWKAFQKDTQGIESGVYDPDSVKAMVEYFDKPLKEKMATQMSPPTLVKANAMADLTPVLSALASNPSSLNDDGTYNPDAPANFEYASVVLSGDKGKEVLESVTKMITERGQAYATALQQRAQQNGASAPAQFMAEMASNYAKGVKPPTYDEIVKDLLSRFNVSTYSTSGPSGGRSGIDKKTSMATAMELAKVKLASSPKNLEVTAAGLGITKAPGMTDADFRSVVESKLAATVYTLAPKDRKNFYTQAGVDKKEAQQSGALWLSHLKSGDFSLANEAAGYLKQMKLGNGLIISNAQVDGRGDLIINLTPPSRFEDPFNGVLNDDALRKLSRVLPNIDATRSAYNAKTMMYEIVLPKESANTNELMNLHSGSMSQNKRPYVGVYTPSGANPIEVEMAEQYTPKPLSGTSNVQVATGPIQIRS